MPNSPQLAFASCKTLAVIDTWFAKTGTASPSFSSGGSERWEQLEKLLTDVLELVTDAWNHISWTGDLETATYSELMAKMENTFLWLDIHLNLELISLSVTDEDGASFQEAYVPLNDTASLPSISDTCGQPFEPNGLEDENHRIYVPHLCPRSRRRWVICNPNGLFCYRVLESWVPMPPPRLLEFMVARKNLDLVTASLSFLCDLVKNMVSSGYLQREFGIEDGSLLLSALDQVLRKLSPPVNP
jgi:hypothetical protein